MIYHTLSNKPYDLQSTITHLQWKAKTQRSRNCTHTGHHASQDCQQTACAGDKSMVVGCISSVWWLVVVGRLDLWYHKWESPICWSFRFHNGWTPAQHLTLNLKAPIHMWKIKPPKCISFSRQNQKTVRWIQHFQCASTTFIAIISNIIAIISQQNLCSHDIPYPPKNSRWWPYKSP